MLSNLTQFCISMYKKVIPCFFFLPFRLHVNRVSVTPRLRFSQFHRNDGSASCVKADVFTLSFPWWKVTGLMAFLSRYSSESDPGVWSLWRFWAANTSWLSPFDLSGTAAFSFRRRAEVRILHAEILYNVSMFTLTAVNALIYLVDCSSVYFVRCFSLSASSGKT